MNPTQQAGQLPETWRTAIVASITRAVGASEVVLIGSRAVGSAHSTSDCDISVILPTYKVLRAARRFPAIEAALSTEFGVAVSVNPLPAALADRTRHNLYVLKVKHEGIRLTDDAKPGSQTAGRPGEPGSGAFRPWEPSSPGSQRAIASYLLSAVHSLLAGVKPESLRSDHFSVASEYALRKAKTQVAQACLLSAGNYVPIDASVEVAEALGAIPAGLMAIEGFLALRDHLLQLLGSSPVKSSGLRSYCRDLQYAALSAVRGNPRWSVPWRYRGVEARLASASLLLLRSLSPVHAGGCDISCLARAAALLPFASPRPPLQYASLCDIVFAEWASAQPLIGIVP